MHACVRACVRAVERPCCHGPGWAMAVCRYKALRCTIAIDRRSRCCPGAALSPSSLCTGRRRWRCHRCAGPRSCMRSSRSGRCVPTANAYLRSVCFRKTGGGRPRGHFDNPHVTWRCARGGCSSSSSCSLERQSQGPVTRPIAPWRNAPPLHPAPRPALHPLPTQVIVAGQAGGEDTQVLLDAVHGPYAPDKVALVMDPSDPADMAFWQVGAYLGTCTLKAHPCERERALTQMRKCFAVHTPGGDDVCSYAVRDENM